MTAGYENPGREKNLSPALHAGLSMSSRSEAGLFEPIMAMVNQSNVRHIRVIYIASRGMWMFLLMFPVSGHRHTGAFSLVSASTDSYGTDKLVVTLLLYVKLGVWFHQTLLLCNRQNMGKCQDRISI